MSASKISGRGFRIGNVFGHGFDAARVAALERLGFTVRPQVSRYKGSQVLRFLDLREGPPLELIEVEDEKEYLDFVPKGMEPHCPGISLVVPEASREALRTYERDFADLEPHSFHVNYDGSDDPGKPGWNDLNVGTPVVPGLFIWLTQLDQPKPVREKIVTHRLGANGVRGLLFDLEPAKLRGFADIAGAQLVDGAFAIGGVTIWSRAAVDDFPATMGKRFPLRAVVLDAADTTRLSRPIHGVRKTSFASQRAILIETNAMCWDLLITGSRQPAEPRR